MLDRCHGEHFLYLLVHLVASFLVVMCRIVVTKNERNIAEKTVLESYVATSYNVGLTIKIKVRLSVRSPSWHITEVNSAFHPTGVSKSSIGLLGWD